MTALLIVLAFVSVTFACALAIALFLTLDKLKRTQEIAINVCEYAVEELQHPPSREGRRELRRRATEAILAIGDL